MRFSPNHQPVADRYDLYRLCQSLAAAVGIVGILKGHITLQQDLAAVVTAFQQITHAMWDTLFGWLYLKPLSGFAKDYLTVTLIFNFAVYHAFIGGEHGHNLGIAGKIFAFVLLLGATLLWPLYVVMLPIAIFAPRLVAADEYKTFAKVAELLRRDGDKLSAREALLLNDQSRKRDLLLRHPEFLSDDQALRELARQEAKSQKYDALKLVGLLLQTLLIVTTLLLIGYGLAQ